VIGQGPGEVAPHIRTPANRTVQFSEITAHETDAPLIVDRAVGARPIAERAPVLGDIDGNLWVVRRYAKHHLRKRFGDYLPSEIGNFLCPAANLLRGQMMIPRIVRDDRA